jgi:hypothetical protein
MRGCRDDRPIGPAMVHRAIASRQVNPRTPVNSPVRAPDHVHWVVNLVVQRGQIDAIAGTGVDPRIDVIRKARPIPPAGSIIR